MISAKDRHKMRVRLLDKIYVLKNRVGSSLVPRFFFRAHLGRNIGDEVALQQAAKLPAFTQMLQQRLAAELREHVDRMDPGIHKIAQNKIDDPVFPAERDCGLGALPRQGVQPGSFSPSQHNA